MFKNQREEQRISVNLAIKISFGTQIVLEGKLKDISLKSAFLVLKGSVHMSPHDEVAFAIASENPSGVIEGTARISRVSVGEGIAIYFTKMDDASTKRLQQLIANGG